MPVSVYIQSAVFFLLAAAALFASAGTFAIAVFWVYLAILAAILVASFLLLDPDLARERMRPGGKKPPLALRLFSGVMVLHWIVAGLDRGRFHWSDTVPLWLQILGLVALAGSYAFCIWAMRVNRFFSSVVRIQSDRGQHCREQRTLRGHPPPGLSRGHRRRAGQRCRARVLDRDRIPCRPDAAVPFLPRHHGGPRFFKPSFRLSGLRPARPLAAHSGPLVRGGRDLPQTLNAGSP